MDNVRIRRSWPAESKNETRVKERNRISKTAIAVIGVVILFGGIGFFVSKYLRSLGLNNDDIISSVSKIYYLPETETPTIATVTDPAKLKSKIFFMNAKSGDKVLIYIKADKVILYRPEENKIINVDRIKTSDIGTPQ
ncbi:hypothetical protein A3I27_01855 [Candidatus Giovannonibacteria bacterium RIFCSPLOWO2_02_FULL_43_11b]|uniref:Uncharacterized protein n=1 Tax=Candidatus Giovannonibacteria bacterium RIFCSPHIGHO2_12_FULL_43_15 TaxID=1798341 RepID=A0A1F5WQT6_9BACT|nr:MAG: hypothetical protein A2739_01855 [Candidatus Giovannonibacteria bacterium RIFCSPHIGHO2_01_FULL_43_100]OGF67820.1 MAG: hypothetical protein A3B97_00885 [Candidatus Giovannonibacteria bacterium RIFCSPHIGHO2_02_FULL_43_32]OGF77980.1 MAG: hypothetical protein A3F23_03240 [Candidatus Giovannonibacteria bacterium RIFCSPHIGHO2_12_FULL_43_15]OGF79501.1 MAG: hypothetical protein A3A15_02105 [Candidatus Giovannonibacteria bacterium RIFCSPLOWO2_01_FULL_43_60]OGF89231.1 MAG: hypothetical protein A3